MKQRPILFSAPMVQAILAGRKTQTRRIVKPQPTYSEKTGFHWKGMMYGINSDYAGTVRNFTRQSCPHGRIGDQLWVRETFSQCLNLGFDENGNAPENLFSYSYKADGGALIGDRWKPSIHMPREASRILLEITDIRIERLNDISDADAVAEGCDNSKSEAAMAVGWYEKPRRAFERLWESINGANSWAENPWVWCVSFKVVEPQGGDV